MVVSAPITENHQQQWGSTKNDKLKVMAVAIDKVRLPAGRKNDQKAGKSPSGMAMLSAVFTATEKVEGGPKISIIEWGVDLRGWARQRKLSGARKYPKRGGNG